MYFESQYLYIRYISSICKCCPQNGVVLRKSQCVSKLIVNKPCVKQAIPVDGYVQRTMFYTARIWSSCQCTMTWCRVIHCIMSGSNIIKKNTLIFFLLSLSYGLTPADCKHYQWSSPEKQTRKTREKKNSRIFPVCTNKIKNAKIESIFRSQKLPTYIVYPVRSCDVFGVLSGHQIWGLVCRKQMRRAGTSNYTPQYLWGVITWPCTWYLLLAIRDPTVCRFRVY